MSIRKASKAEFVEGLLEIAAEAFGLDDAGEVISNGEQLRRQLWKTANGYEEVVKADDGTVRKIKHPPAAWAQQFLYSMIVGKPAPMAADAGAGVVKAADKVRELARQRLNSIALAVSGPPKSKGKQQSERSDDE